MREVRRTQKESAPAVEHEGGPNVDEPALYKVMFPNLKDAQLLRRFVIRSVVCLLLDVRGVVGPNRVVVVIVGVASWQHNKTQPVST